jgi:hypothetical protein
MHFAHIDHFIEGLTAAAIVARVLADSSSGSRQGIIKNNRLERILKTAFLVELKETGNVHAQRATVFAWREGEFLADTRATAVRDNVVFILFAEMANGGEHRIGRGLAESTERTLPNHAT